jgi:hypothetical protein
VLNGLNGFVHTVATKDVLPAMERRVASLNAVVTRYILYIHCSIQYTACHCNVKHYLTCLLALLMHWHMLSMQTMSLAFSELLQAWG